MQEFDSCIFRLIYPHECLKQKKRHLHHEAAVSLKKSFS